MKNNLNTILQHTKEDGECLIWTKCANTDGYPRAAINGNSNAKVHRVVWELHNNSSADGRVVRHTCDNPLCINPKHLQIGSPADNVRDRDERGRHRGLKIDDVLTIKHLYSKKLLSVREIAKIFSVTTSAVYYSLHHRKVGT